MPEPAQVEQIQQSSHISEHRATPVSEHVQRQHTESVPELTFLFVHFVNEHVQAKDTPQ